MIYLQSFFAAEGAEKYLSRHSKDALVACRADLVFAQLIDNIDSIFTLQTDFKSYLRLKIDNAGSYFCFTQKLKTYLHSVLTAKEKNRMEETK